MKITFFCMGSGEASQAVALAKVALKRGHKCSLVATIDSAYQYSKNAGIETIAYLKWPKRVARSADDSYSAEEVFSLIEQTVPDVLVLCNSKATSWGFLEKRSKKAKLVVSVDSNWLFNQYKDVEIAPWIDHCIVTFPDEVFRAGLKVKGGHYEIAPMMLKKIHPAGFIPSVEEISDAERKKIRSKYTKDKKKIISGYFGWKESFTEELAKKVASAIGAVSDDNAVLVYSSDKDYGLPGAIYDREYLMNPENFKSVLSSSDLVIAHQGMITLFQSIGAKVPIISNVPGKGNYRSGNYHTSYYETQNLSLLNLCLPIERDAPIEILSKNIKNLLFEGKPRRKMVEAQRKYYKPGEEKSLKLIEDWYNSRID